jgi:hypothetical protein
MPFERKPPGQIWRFSLDTGDSITAPTLSRKKFADKWQLFKNFSYSDCKRNFALSAEGGG